MRVATFSSLVAVLPAIAIVGLVGVPSSARGSEPSAWSDLLSFRPTASTQQTVAASSGGLAPWIRNSVLPIENAFGATNLDEYDITVTRLPSGYTAPAYFEYVRTHFNDFLDPALGQFYPYSDRYRLGTRDSVKWGSANPVDAMMSLTLGPLENASVVISANVRGTNSGYFRASPLWTYFDGTHPVSGTREWGYRRNTNGSWTFYTRGVDRLTNVLWGVVGDVVFGSGEDLWEEFQRRLVSDVQRRGGSATSVPPDSTRYPWAAVCGDWQPTVPWVGDPVLRHDEKCTGSVTTPIPLVQSPELSVGTQFQNANSGTASGDLDFTDWRPAPTASFRIPARSSATFIDPAPAGYTGGAFAVSDRPLSAVSNFTVRSTRTLASVRDQLTGARRLDVPLLQKDNFGYDSWFVVQNPSLTDVDYSVRYIDSDGRQFSSSTGRLPGLMTMRVQSSSVSGAPPTFSALIEASGDIIGTVFQESSTRLLAYQAFGSDAAGTRVSVPLVMANHYGYDTGIQIQNAGTSGVYAYVDFSRNIAVPPAPGSGRPQPCTFPSGAPTQRVVFIPPGASRTVSQSAAGDPQFRNGAGQLCDYVGGATITATQPLVAVVNETGLDGASAYEATNVNQIGNRVSLPLLQANNFRVNSGIQIQNAGTSSKTFSFSYGANTAVPSENRDGLLPCTTKPGTRSYTLGAGEAVNIQQQDDFVGCVYIGSATVDGPASSKVSAIVNQRATDFVDVLSTYTAGG